METPAKTVMAQVKKSEYLKKIQSIRNGLYGISNYRNLTKAEIEQLVSQGCCSRNWKQVKVLKGFGPDSIWNVSFFGPAYLGKFSSKEVQVKGINLKRGVYRSSLYNVVVGSDTLINNVNALSNYVVDQGAVLWGCGTISHKPGANFGNNVEIPIIVETGGREVMSYAELTIEVADMVSTSRNKKRLLSDYQKSVSEYSKKAESNWGYIGVNARIIDCPRIDNCFIGESAHIENPTAVINSTVLSNPDEKTEITDGAWVKNSIVQWGCEVTTMGIVSESVLVEHSHVERHGKVTASIIGANTGIGQGEVTSCLVGPFVGFHHQALLIGAYWPEGKGNVSYGANVGSNHTSKAPDQEIWAGEGTFFGLGVNIKFPADFSKAPYSIIATAVNTLPQKMEFPFSLINSRAGNYQGVSPAYNELIPGWVLSDNIFTIRRNQGKYQARNKGRRSIIEFQVFRPRIMDLVIEARNRLEQVSEIKEIYTAKDIKGLGKNYMTEQSRIKGIEAYAFYLKYYALCGLKNRVEKNLDEGKNVNSKILSKKSKDLKWEHERKILVNELDGFSVKDCLKLLLEIQTKIARDVQISKEKDDKRGAATIPDYAYAHEPAAKDSVVVKTWDETKKINKQISSLIRRF
ncbi:MAG: DUF4954 family protein [bacterium]